MHGLINRGIECFLRDTYGRDAWHEIAVRADLGHTRFEAMLHYDDTLTDAVLRAAAGRLGVPRDMLLEDLGTYLVSNPKTEAIRRLMRFGGASFEDFLHSLEDLSDRARLAVPDLSLPEVELEEEGPGAFRLCVAPGLDGMASVLVGMLRTMADDYGVLVLVEHDGTTAGRDLVRVRLLDHAFAEGRQFDLTRRSG
jgi:hypothetical protein